MFKKVFSLVLFFVIFTFSAYSQYSDDAPSTKDSNGYAERKTLFTKLGQSAVTGLEFMVNGGGGYFFGELSPFAGVKVLDPLIVGVGLHGSVLSGGNISRTYYGGQAFARLTIMNQFFLHAEYRVIYSKILGNTPIKTPIYGIGFVGGGGSSWVMIGFASNQDFQKINPFASVVYRIGFYF
jgi:hypothetical protein